MGCTTNFPFVTVFNGFKKFYDVDLYLHGNDMLYDVDSSLHGNDLREG